MCCSEPIRQERVPHFLIITRQLLSSVCMCGTGAPIIRSFHEFIHGVKRGGGGPESRKKEKKKIFFDMDPSFNMIISKNFEKIWRKKKFGFFLGRRRGGKFAYVCRSKWKKARWSGFDRLSDEENNVWQT